MALGCAFLWSENDPVCDVVEWTALLLVNGSETNPVLVVLALLVFLLGENTFVYTEVFFFSKRGRCGASGCGAEIGPGNVVMSPSQRC